MTNDRQSKLLLLLLSRGQVSVHEIATALDASPATVRRDLADLEKSGQIDRLHGSARIATGSKKELAFSAREDNQIAAKRAIAQAAAALVRPNEAILLDAGTTVLQLARHIKSNTVPVNVFTNGLAIAQELAHAAHVNVTLIGGRVRSENLSMVGPAAVSMLGGLWFDRVFLGVSAIDAQGRISSLDADEAETNAQMVRRSGELVVLADHTKFDTRTTHAVTTLGAGDRLISDAPPKGAFAAYLDTAGVAFTQSTPLPALAYA
ncbi:DeoR/GlpR family DNA-binding transcription regulator [Octadecabacter sp. R77987]|uniref:DeoR/GlpR family DNA-binding transcription regulator n=1 Tax=Octadecabacter sp. R77987 TaxID=3093874 RepID=UPI00366C0C0B